MNAREEATKIYNKLRPHLLMGPFQIKGGQKRRSEILGWLKYYGADGKKQYSTSGHWYIFEKKRSMGGTIKNPQQICEYCRLIDAEYRKARTPKEKRRALARFKLHKRALHKNPPSKTRIKIARVAYKLAFKLYKHFKTSGVPRYVTNRIPSSVKPYVLDILAFNGVPILNK